MCWSGEIRQGHTVYALEDELQKLKTTNPLQLGEVGGPLSLFGGSVLEKRTLVIDTGNGNTRSMYITIQAQYQLHTAQRIQAQYSTISTIAQYETTQNRITMMRLVV
jgi:hypothetical protein